jgi:hypothetical protein
MPPAVRDGNDLVLFTRMRHSNKFSQDKKGKYLHAATSFLSFTPEGHHREFFSVGKVVGVMYSSFLLSRKNRLLQGNLIQ